MRSILISTMKLAILLFALLPIMAFGYSMRASDGIGRSFTILGPTGAGCSTALSARKAFRSPERAVDRAFVELMDELNRRPAGDNGVSKSKEWVERSFRLFSELNRDTASSNEDLERKEEMLQKQQKWTNKLIEFADEIGQDLSTIKPQTQVSQQSTDSGKKTYEPTVSSSTDIAPIYSIKDDVTSFQVELELPGVALEDIDLQLEKESNILYVSGQRRVFGSAEITKFSMRFPLEPAVDVHQISAKLNNGIMTISAPKKKVEENDYKKRIPVVLVQ